MARNAKTLLAVILAATLGMGAVSPAQASGGQISINLAPANAQQQRVIQTGLGIYALAKQIENGSITQRGNNNAAGIAQGGGGNLGIVHQQGNSHNGTITQQNGGNSYGLFQFGRGTNAHVNQNGGQSGLGLVFGW